MQLANKLGLTKPPAAPKPDGVNHEGHVAFSESDRQTIARLALTGVLANGAYVSEDKLADEMVKACGTAAEKDPAFLLKAAKASRAANFKLFPKVAMAALIAKAPRMKPEFDAVVVSSMAAMLSGYSAGQLLELALLIKGKLYGVGLSHRAKRILGEALGCITTNRLEDMTLSDREDMRRLLRLVHPSDLHEEAQKILRFCLGDKPTGEPTQRQGALQDLKNFSAINEISDAGLGAIISSYKLPFNATKGVVGGRGVEVWKAIAANMSPLQLLLNLKSLDEKLAMDPRTLEKRLMEVDIDRVRLVPHDVLRPIDNAPQKYREALVTFLSRLASKPLPGLADKRVGVLMDISGSMDENNRGPWKLAATLATPILVSCPDRYLAYFGTNVYPETGERRGNTFPYLKGVPAAAVLHNLLPCPCPEGTYTDKAVRHFAEERIPLDVLFIFTDEQENGRRTAYDEWRKYRAQVSPKAKLVIVNVSTAKWHLAPGQNKDGVVHIQSITPLIYRQFERYDQSAVDFIESFA
jgi:hypothetical protein